MAIFNQWLIGLDNTGMDDHLFRFIKSANNPLMYQDLYFVHIASSVGLTDKVGPQNEVDDGVTKIKNEIENTVRKNFPDKKFQLKVKHGNPAKELMKLSDEIDPDLLVLGRKPKSGAEGVVPEEMVVVSNCSTLLLPEFSTDSIENIAVATDFSEISKKAVQIAVDIATQTKAKLYIQHVCTVPSDFRRTGKSYKDYTEKQQMLAEKEAEKFFENFQSKPEISYSFADKNKTADSIAAFAKDHTADLVIMGSKGRTNAASAFLGSVAEKTATKMAEVPLLVVKKKNANLNWLQAMAR